MEKPVDLAIATIIFLIAITDLYKGIAMSFSSRHPLLFIAQFGFGLLRLLPLIFPKRS